MTTQYHVTIQVGYGILGIGTSKMAAQRDAMRNAREGDFNAYNDTAASYHESRDGDILTIVCDDALAQKILEEGGNQAYDVVDGCAYLPE